MRPVIPFLMRVWGRTCDEGDYVCLSTKDAVNEEWGEHSFQFKKKTIRSKLKEWLLDYDANDYDIYFCPLPFKAPRRLEEKVSCIKCLWSDIDEGNPKLKPSILWESSPGRLQGLWFLSGDALNPEDGKQLNKALTYYMDADKGGWDLTQVLRVPGTKNHKYKETPTVKVIKEDPDLVYTPAKVAKRIGFDFSDPNKPEEITHTDSLSFEEVYSKYRKKIPPKVRQLLTQKTVSEGKRSDIIWYMENKLSEVGLSAQEIITLVKHSAWNKFKGRSDEDKRLRSELEKIVESKVSVKKTKQKDTEDEEEDEEEHTPTADLIIENFHDLMSASDKSPGWLIKGWWLNRSHGIVAGEPKSFKSTLALDLAVSVASGKPFMDKYEVISPGPVVYIQNENSTWIMKDRVTKISASKGIKGEVDIIDESKISVEWPPNIPLYFINQQSYMLTDPLHQQILEKIIAQYEPSLIILDPLYLMFDGDINSAKELAPVLQWLLDIRYRLNCGVMLIHHWGKSSGETKRRGGQRMLGSTTLHGWVESAWYIHTEPTENPDDLDDDEVNSEIAEAEITIEREFRGAGLHPKVDSTIMMGEIGSFEYEIKAKVHRGEKKPSKKNPEKEILHLLSMFNTPLTLRKIQEDAGLSMSETKNTLDVLAGKGKVKNTRGKYILVIDK